MLQYAGLACRGVNEGRALASFKVDYRLMKFQINGRWLAARAR